MGGRHTPGPWNVIENGDYVMAGDLYIADMDASVTLDTDDRLANAHLVAAAPDLLADATASRALVAVMADHLDYALGHLRRESHDNWCALNNGGSETCTCWVTAATDGLRDARAHLASDAAIRKARGEP